MFGAAYNTSGPPIVVYASGQGWKPDQVRGTLQSYFLFSSTAIAASHGIAGLWTRQVALLYLASAPALALGLSLGGTIGRQTRPERFEHSIHACVVVLGLSLLL